MTPTLLLAALAAAPYTMHEWGTFTSVAGDDGVALQWRPLEGRRDLPNFVHEMQGFPRGLRSLPRGKGEIHGSVRMETPVIYFYPREEMTVEASVTFPGGLITEWYPMARDWSGPTLTWGRFTVTPRGHDYELPTERRDSNYYAARNVDAAMVQVCGENGHREQERFLFYRGVGTFSLPMLAKLDGANVSISGPRGATIVFERRGDKLGFAAVPAGDTVKLARPTLDAKVEDAGAALERVLIATGLYEREAKAMVATWKGSWFEEGVRVFSLLGTDDVNHLLPLTLSPAPAESVRVLVARIELLTPEPQAAFVKATLAEPKEALRKEGRFGEPLLTLAIAKATGTEKAKLQATLATVTGQSGQTFAW